MTRKDVIARLRGIMGADYDMLDRFCRGRASMADVGNYCGCNDPDAAESFGERMGDEWLEQIRTICRTDPEISTYLAGVAA